MPSRPPWQAATTRAHSELTMQGHERRHGPWLWLALAAFVVRVVAQPAARATGWPVLPPFDAWHSGALPYPWLLSSQLLLVAWMARTAWRVSSGADKPRAILGRGLGGVAVLYGAVMLARLLLGLTMFRGHWWLDAPLPTIFHLVIASYLGVYAHFHLAVGGLNEGRR